MLALPTDYFLLCVFDIIKERVVRAEEQRAIVSTTTTVYFSSQRYYRSDSTAAMYLVPFAFGVLQGRPVKVLVQEKRETDTWASPVR